MTVRRLVGAIRAAVLAALPLTGLLAGVSPAAAGGGPFYYPSTCGPTLQECVDSVSAGDTVYVQVEVVSELIQIRKSLTLAAVPDLRPKIDGIFVSTNGPNTVHITIRSFESLTGIGALFTEGTGHSLAIRDVIVDGEFGLFSGVSLGTLVPASFVVENSSIHSSGDEPGLGFSPQLTSGNASLVAVGNRIDQHGNPEGGAGIDLAVEGAGTVRMDVMNNSVWDVARCNCGNSAGITVNVSNTAHVEANVVGNTVERSRGPAFSARNDVDTSGHMNLDLFNNVFAHSGRRGIDIDSAHQSTMTFRAGNNDTFKNPDGNFFDGNNPGTGNLSVDPQFLDRAVGNLRLKSSSPVIDKGVVCSPGGVADPDAVGKHRLAGKSVDLGAYERGAKKPTGEVQLGGNGAGGDLLVGTDGADILCGNGGRDFIDGAGGNDYLDGGTSSDTIIGGLGSDVLFGRDGNDRLCTRDGVKGNDRLNGGKGHDEYRIDANDVRVAVEVKGDCAD